MSTMTGQSLDEAYEHSLRYSPLGDSRNRSVPCRFHKRGDPTASTWNWNGVCTDHQHLLEKA
jgi:hypothetical protein